MYSTVAPGVPGAGPARTAFMAALSANVNVAVVVGPVVHVAFINCTQVFEYVDCESSEER